MTGPRVLTAAGYRLVIGLDGAWTWIDPIGRRARDDRDDGLIAWDGIELEEPSQAMWWLMQRVAEMG